MGNPKKTNPAAAGKSMKMGTDELKELIKSAVQEAMGGEAGAGIEDAPLDGITTGDVLGVMEQAIASVTEKRNARKEAGEDVGEITPDEIIAEAAAILETLATPDEGMGDDEDPETKADDEGGEEKGDEGDDGAKRRKAAAPAPSRQVKTAAPARVVERKYANIFMGGGIAAPAKQQKKIPPMVQLARAIKCLDVFGRHDPERAAYYAKKYYDDQDMNREFKALSATNPTAGGFLIPEVYLDEVIELLYTEDIGIYKDADCFESVELEGATGVVASGKADVTKAENLIAALEDLRDVDDDFYFVLTDVTDEACVTALCQWAESTEPTEAALGAGVEDHRKFYFGQIVKNKAYVNQYGRSAVLYVDDPAEWADAAWVGCVGPFWPESVTWKWKVPDGVSVPDLRDSERDTLENAFVNFMTVEYKHQYRRIQERLYRMFGVDGTDNLHFATCAKSLGAGLYEQLKRFVREHPGTNLIIIDTLQKIREASNERYSYANDYEIIGQLKAFADEANLCLLIVHHTRKQQADDSFDRISGTNGLLGAADGAFIMEKEKRTGDTAVLEVSGRDQPEQKLVLKKNMERLVWELERAETELWQAPPDPILEKVATMLSEEVTEWNGSPTELAETLQVDTKPNLLTKHLNVNKARLFNDYQIDYEPIRTHAGRRIILKRIIVQRDDA